jgi:hypothetical protein
MLGFVTSVRARALAQNWDYHVWLLQCTLNSMLAQTCDDFHVFLVCHDVPDIPQVKHPKVTTISVDFRPPMRNNDAMCADKVIKISIGAERAVQAGCSYVMFADADDLINRRLSAFVRGRQGSAGWIFDVGYCYRHGDNYLRKIKNFHMICGSCSMVNAEHLRFVPDPNYGGRRVNSLAAAGHTEYLRVLKSEGHVLARLPFCGAAYVQHEDSTSDVPGGLGSKNLVTGKDRRPAWRKLASRIKSLSVDLWEMRPMTTGLRAQFQIPASGQCGFCQPNQTQSGQEDGGFPPGRQRHLRGPQ